MKRLLSRSRSAAFTLIELLTVITIIAILMAMLFPMIGQAKESARQRKADGDLRIIVQATQQYNVEYGQFPQINPNPSTTAATTDDACGDKAAQMQLDNCNLFNILRDFDKTPNDGHKQNPRKVQFLEGKPVSTPSNPRDGFLDNPSAGAGVLGAWYDPWGSQYNVVIDTNADNVLDLTKFYNDFKADQAPHISVGAFSLGKDKMLGTKGDKTYKKDTEPSDDRLSWVSR